MGIFSSKRSRKDEEKLAEERYLKERQKEEERDIEGVSKDYTERRKEKSIIHPSVYRGRELEITEKMFGRGERISPFVEKLKKTEVGQEAGRLAGEASKYAEAGFKGVIQYPRKKLETWRKEYETEKEAKGIYERAYRKHKIETAHKRGEATEQRHYREKVEREVGKLALESERKQIGIAAEKAYRIEKAKIAAREKSKLEKEARIEERAKIDALRDYQIQTLLAAAQSQQVQQPQQRRRIYNPFTVQAAQALDPMGIYSFRPPQRRLQQTQGQQFQQTQQQPRPNMDWMNFLLGGQENPKSGKRRKVYNFFTGVWE